MAFVTQYKLKRVLGSLNGDFSKDPLTRYLSSKYFYLSDKNVNLITIYYRFLKNPVNFIEDNHLKWEDTGRNAIEVQPAYHLSGNCRALHARFDNIILPPEIRSSEDLLEEARDIARNVGLYQFGAKSEEELEHFVAVCLEQMNQNHENLALKREDFEIVQKENSGAEEYRNYTLKELKQMLEEIILLSKFYFGMDEKGRLVLPNDFYQRPYKYPEKLSQHNRSQVLHIYRNALAIIARKEYVSYNNTDFCGDQEIIQIAKEIGDRFVNPTISLIEKELMKNVDKTDFSRTILEILGFKPCASRDCSSLSELSEEEKAYVDQLKIA